MIKYLILISLYIILNDYSLVKKIPIKTNRIITDHLENLYAVSDYSLTKFDSEGKELYTYSNAYLGEVSYVDVSDPYRILLFFKDFNQIQLLDKNFAEIASPISLDDLNITQAEIACISNLGGFWVYDSQSTQLLYYDRALDIKAETLPVNSVVDIVLQPNFLIEKNDFLYLNLPDVGILIFDKFGSYYKKIPLVNLRSFQVNGNDILFFEKKSIYSYNHELMKTTSITIPDTMGVHNARIERNNIYIHKAKQMFIYSKNTETDYND